MKVGLFAKGMTYDELAESLIEMKVIIEAMIHASGNQKYLDYQREYFSKQAGLWRERYDAALAEFDSRPIPHN